MTATLKRQLQSLPVRPGVYQFFTTAGKLLYVGKAKNLRSRVRSYFQPGADLSPAKQLMVREIDRLVATEVSNETEALLLERTLIKQHQPPYNVDLKDDKSWLYLAIDYREAYPPVALVRRPQPTRQVHVFGPYASSGTIRQSFALFKKILGLKTCANPPDKPCFLASLGRCLGHNLGPGSKQHYRANLRHLEQLLRGEVGHAIAELEQTMHEAAHKHEYERASRLRDQIRALARLKERQSVVAPSRESFDVLGLARGVDEAAIARLRVRRGLLLDPERFLVAHTRGLNDAEVLEGFMEQYYLETTDKPRQAFIPPEFRRRVVAGIRLATPSRGKKRTLLSLAEKAATSHLRESTASWERKKVRARTGLAELKRLLDLPQEPQRIEGYDISNIQGRDAVGAMVVLGKGLPDPKSYRQFRIQLPERPNDFAMLAEVLTRRFTKNKDWPKPNLVMLDGGAGQLSAVTRALTAAKISVPLVALAKREELLYVPGQREPLKLPHDSAGLLLLMELRDEAHRFGITFHRSRHRKQVVQSLWDELPGVGPVIKRKLKAAVGSPLELRRTPLEKLAKIVGQSRAQGIREYLQKH